MHLLTVGATGMLRGVVCRLAEAATAVTLIARTPQSLTRLARTLPSHCQVLCLMQDWCGAAHLKGAVQRAVAQQGAPQQVLLWTQALVVACALPSAETAIPLWHVLSHEYSDPEYASRLLAPFASLEAIEHRAVVLAARYYNGERALVD